MFLKKLLRLIPSRRRAEELDMQRELNALREIAGGPEIGNLALVAEDGREVWTWTWIEHLIQDLRYAIRSIRHNKVFVTVAVLSLALGIGANTAIYSFIDAILLRPLPVPAPDSVVILKWKTPGPYASTASTGMSFTTEGTHRVEGEGLIGTEFPYPALQLFQSNTATLAEAFCYFVSAFNVTIQRATESVKGDYVSGNYFRGMGVGAAAGRTIVPIDDAAAAEPVAMLSYRYSERRFGSAAAAIGQSIRINDKPFTVVGVAPADFFGAEPGYVPDVFVALHSRAALEPSLPGFAPEQQFTDPHYYWIEVMGRLKPGVSVDQAQAVLAPQFRRFSEDSATTERERSALPALRVAEGATGLDSLQRRYSKPIYVLAAMVGSILLIACANLANLLLARATARQREIAVRLSIGAGRARLIRQLLTESVALSLTGGALGIAFALWGMRVMTLLLANGRENFTLHAELNWHVLGVALALSLLTGLAFGLAPALQATRVDLTPALKELRTGWQGRPGSGGSRFRVSHVLIVAQIFFSLLLLVTAGLFGRTLSRLHSINLGFNRENILLFTIRPGAAGYSGDALNRLYASLRERIAQLPGVRDVSLSSGALPTGGGTRAPVTLAGAPADATPSRAGILAVGPSFFSTLQIPIVQGREFDDQDRPGAPRVAVINQRLAQSFGVENPIGQTMVLGTSSYEIVGVVGDALYIQLKEDLQPMAYFPYMQSARPPYGMVYELRTAGDPLDQAAGVRQIVNETDFRLSVFDLQTQNEHIDQMISEEITLSRLCTALALLALMIACVGLYGTVAFNVERRTSEIGIRMTLGAQRARIIWMVARDVLALSLAGLALGIPVFLAGARYIKSFLYGITPNDPVSFVGAVAVLLLAGLIAAFVPARRASQIDPVIAIRHE